MQLVTSIVDAINPLHWSSAVYWTLIVVLLLLRVFKTWSDHGVSRFLEELCLILPAGLLYFSIRGLEGANAEVAFQHARDIVEFEKTLGIYHEPRLQELIIDHPRLVDLFNWIYVWAHWPVILTWVVWMWFRHRDDYPVYRNAVLISGAAGMIVFALYPAAPPRLVPELSLVDTVSLQSQSYRVLQPPSLTNIYASMPSLHFGWNFLVGIAIARHANSRCGRLIGVTLPIAMFSAIVMTANHYLVDGIIGGMFALAALATSTYVTPHWSRALDHISLSRIWQRFQEPTAGSST